MASFIEMFDYVFPMDSDKIISSPIKLVIGMDSDNIRRCQI